MKKVSEQARAIMSKYTDDNNRNMEKVFTEKNRDAFNDDMRKAQIEMINHHFDNMDEEAQARALVTLSQIGGSLVDQILGFQVAR